jgi:hypothetical protein
MYNKNTAPVNKLDKGLNLSGNQTSDVPRNLKHEILTIPSTSQFAFGGYGVLDFKEKNVKVHELIIAFNTSAVSGLTGTVTNFPNLNPTFHWFTRIELVMNNVVIDTLYPDAQFILNQLMYEEQDRTLNNYSAGLYSSQASRNTLTTTAGSNWYLPLKTFFNQANIAIITQNHELQLRVYMQPLANICNQSTLTGTPVCTINSAQLIARVTRLPTEAVNATIAQISRSPRHYKFYETRYATFTVQSGVTSTTLVLTPIVGNVGMLYFVVRPSASLTGNNAFSFTAIRDFAMLGAGGDNIVGGTVIPSTLNLLQQGKWWCKSQYLADVFAGTSNSNVYSYCFSADPTLAFDSGAFYTTRKFVGAEQLQLTFTGSLGANVQVDVFAYLEAAIEQTNLGVKKLAIDI